MPLPNGTAVTTAVVALWLAHHEPKPGRAMEWIVERLGAGSRAAGVAAALVAARHGETPMPAGVAARLGETPMPAGIPAGIGEVERLRSLASRLAGAGSSS
jgi:hypothetical protein